jgi:hypothetical protein
MRSGKMVCAGRWSVTGLAALGKAEKLEQGDESAAKTLQGQAA